MQLTLSAVSTRVTSQLLAIKLAAQVSFAPCALAGARGAEAASHLAPAGPQGVGGPGDASAVRWGGLGGKNDIVCSAVLRACSRFRAEGG